LCQLGEQRRKFWNAIVAGKSGALAPRKHQTSEPPKKKVSKVITHQVEKKKELKFTGLPRDSCQIPY
jgi:hypothetical protein